MRTGVVSRRNLRSGFLPGRGSTFYQRFTARMHPGRSEHGLGSRGGVFPGSWALICGIRSSGVSGAFGTFRSTFLSRYETSPQDSGISHVAPRSFLVASCLFSICSVPLLWPTPCAAVDRSVPDLRAVQRRRQRAPGRRTPPTRQRWRELDVGYPRIAQRPDGRVVVLYCYNHGWTETLSYRYVAATLFDPGD